METYSEIIVESFIPLSTSGLHGKVHIRPIKGQEPFLPEMNVECSKSLSEDFPVGTKFRFKAKISSREGGTEYVYSHFKWMYSLA